MRGVAVAIIIGMLVGCGPLKPHRATQWLGQINPFTGTPDKVIIKSYLLEAPIGDDYLMTGLWRDALAPLDAPTRALFAENGLRVAKFSGNPPYQFLALARSPDVVRPQEGTVAIGEMKSVLVHGPLAKASFQAWTEIGGPPGQFDLSDAEIALNVTANTADTGKLAISFEPRVQHGPKQIGWRPNLDSTAFTWLDQKVQERFPALKTETLLAPDEFLILGPTEIPARTLGGTAFVLADAGRPRMRVLVLQAGRWTNPAAMPNPGRRASVVAAHAGQTVIRGQSR
jgi:hypothetical protein